MISYLSKKTGKKDNCHSLNEEIVTHKNILQTTNKNAQVRVLLTISSTSDVESRFSSNLSPTSIITEYA